MEGSARPISLDASRERFARRQFCALIETAMDDLDAVCSGDLAAAYDAHRAIGRAVRLLLDNRWDAA